MATLFSWFFFVNTALIIVTAISFVGRNVFKNMPGNIFKKLLLYEYNGTIFNVYARNGTRVTRKIFSNHEKRLCLTDLAFFNIKAKCK